MRVYLDMVADIFHIGHLNLIKRAKNLEDSVTVVVGIHSDEDVGKYKRIPIMEQEHRYQIVSSCRYVDEVIKAAPLEITEEFIKKNNIDLVVHGDDITSKIVAQHKQIKKIGKVKYMPRTEGISTTEIIEKIKKL